jgi:hypothetical protein
MRFMTRWFAASAMHSQQEVAERAARVIDHVIFDLGVERLVQGTVALDARLRPHFFSAQPLEARAVLACVPLARLAEARALAPHAARAGGRSEPVADLVEGLLREFRAQSPRFRALPASPSRPH